MEKLIFLGWRERGGDVVALGDEVVAAARVADAVDGVRATTACVEAPEARVMRWGEDPRGLVLAAYVSTWIDRLELREPVEAALAATGLTWSAYVAIESSPIEYGNEKTWPDGERSPGISLVTAFRRVEGLDDESFYGGWHGSHTPLTFEIHAFWQYQRHAVLRGLTDGAPAFDAIVLESNRRLEDMLDFKTFFGAKDDAELAANIARVDEDLAKFADRSTLQTTPMHEVIVRSPPWW